MSQALRMLQVVQIIIRPHNASLVLSWEARSMTISYADARIVLISGTQNGRERTAANSWVLSGTMLRLCMVREGHASISEVWFGAGGGDLLKLTLGFGRKLHTSTTPFLDDLILSSEHEEHILARFKPLDINKCCL